MLQIDGTHLILLMRQSSHVQYQIVLRADTITHSITHFITHSSQLADGPKEGDDWAVFAS